MAGRHLVYNEVTVHRTATFILILFQAKNLIASRSLTPGPGNKSAPEQHGSRAATQLINFNQAYPPFPPPLPERIAV